ncbi:hypothetical protein [Nocardioides euryhalodurans]|uniref:Uncharacterized protein n=1 Tax=Nocardioides euryhalodurans TaxID=2518370 RepID=A0A4P7GKX7_9ACTN|nr:hypothetical protein [Nocardioides euryhalodurans]QBR92725.1 hypothetical protein EXE57_10885 [Nocardioides euryhalodurans]
MNELETYLRNHWTAAAGGVDLAHRVAGSHRGTDLGPPLATIATDIREDRTSLAEVMDQLGCDRGHVGPLAARVLERMGRLKPNGRLLRRSPVSDVLEVEALRSAVAGKASVWDALLAMQQRDGLAIGVDLEQLRARATDQLARLTGLHADLAHRALGRGA